MSIGSWSSARLLKNNVEILKENSLIVFHTWHVFFTLGDQEANFSKWNVVMSSPLVRFCRKLKFTSVFFTAAVSAYKILRVLIVKPSPKGMNHK